MARITETTRRWQKRVRDIEDKWRSLLRENRELKAFNDAKIIQLDKLKNSSELSARMNSMIEESLRNEIRYLRELVEKLALSPKMRREITNGQIREREQTFAEERIYREVARKYREDGRPVLNRESEIARDGVNLKPEVSVSKETYGK